MVPLEFGEPIDGVFSPDLVGIRCQIDLSFGVAVENVRLLVVEIDEILAFAFIFEKRLIRADHFSVLMETLSHARAQTDQVLHTVSRQERIAENLL